MSCRIFRHSTLEILEVVNGKNCLYECRCAEVILENFTAKVEQRALALGFSPAVSINGYPLMDWHPTGASND
jgi:hypothetical protein